MIEVGSSILPRNARKIKSYHKLHVTSGNGMLGVEPWWTEPSSVHGHVSSPTGTGDHASGSPHSQDKGSSADFPIMHCGGETLWVQV